MRDGRIITGAGISSSLDARLFLIQLLLGKDTAIEVTRRIEYEVADPKLWKKRLISKRLTIDQSRFDITLHVARFDSTSCMNVLPATND